MCNWCKKQTVGIPMVSGDSLPMICENCGTKIDERLRYSNYKEWAKNIVKVMKEREE
jgi:hypothetical protein